MAKKTAEEQIRESFRRVERQSAFEVARVASELLPERVFVCYKEGKHRTASETLYNLDLKNRDWTPVAAYEGGKKVSL